MGDPGRSGGPADAGAGTEPPPRPRDRTRQPEPRRWSARRPSPRRASGRRRATRRPVRRLAGWALVRAELGLAAELAALCGLAFAQPVLGPFGNSPETFIAFGATRGDIVVFALLVAVVPVLAVWALAGAFRAFGDGIRANAQTIMVGLLGGLAATYLVRQAVTTTPWRVFTFLGVAFLLANLHERFEPGRLFLRYAAPLPIFVVGLFLFASPIAPLVLPPSEPAATSSASSRPPVVFIVLDEMPTLSMVDGTGELDADLVPNLARLAATSTWYRNHTAAAAFTGTALPVMLTGRHPETPTFMPPANRIEFPDNLLSRLSKDYAINGTEWVTSFCPAGECQRRRDLGAEAASLLRASTAGDVAPLGSLVREGRSLWWSQVWPLSADFQQGFTIGGTAESADQRRRTVEFIDGIEPSEDGRPVLDYLHTALPHQPWNLLPSGQAYNAPEAPHGGEFLLTWPGGDLGRELALAARSQHLLQVQWADRLLGAVFDRLQAVGRWDDALVIVTGDHGTSFQSGGALRVTTPTTEAEVAWAPLFVKLPHQKVGATDDTATTALDLLPTVLDVTGLDAGRDLPGHSLARGPVGTPDPRPFVAPESTGFDIHLGEGIIGLGSDGLSVITSGGSDLGYGIRRPGDPLAVWRHGRHGDLLGRRSDELGVCLEPGPAVQREVPDGWGAYTRRTLPADRLLPLWHTGTIASSESIDVAIVVDGVLVGWSPTISNDNVGRFGILVTEPLVKRGAGTPQLYQVVDQPGCRLRAMAG